MSRVRFLFVISVPGFVTLLIGAISGFILWLVIPHGGQHGGKGLDGSDTTFIWVRQTWVDIHNWVAVAFLVIMVIHIYMHWQWLYRQAKAVTGLKK